MEGNKGKGEKMSENISEGDKTWETLNSGKWTRVGGKGGGQGRELGWLGDGHWGGHLAGWALGVMLHVGKLNSNKKKLKKKKENKCK